MTHDDIVKDIAQIIKDSVQDGIKSVSDKFSSRIEALEKSLEQVSEKEIDLSPIEEMVSKKIEALPKPKDGEDGKNADPVNMDEIKRMVNDAVTEAVSNISIPEPKDGKDGLQIEIEPSIDESKSYHRGTYALHHGGLWRSFEKTNGMRGWETVLEGIKSVDISFDGKRDFAINIEKTSGALVSKEFNIPAMIYKDVWREGEYKSQDCVTLSGSLWVALKETSSRPGESSDDWRIVAKKGGTGKSAFDIAKEIGFEGTREQWVESLGKKTVVKI